MGLGMRACPPAGVLLVILHYLQEEMASYFRSQETVPWVWQTVESKLWVMVSLIWVLQTGWSLVLKYEFDIVHFLYRIVLHTIPKV